MKELEQKIQSIYKASGLSHREVVQSLALITASGIAAMGEKGIKVSSDEIEILITIKIKDNKNAQ